MGEFMDNLLLNRVKKNYENYKYVKDKSDKRFIYAALSNSVEGIHVIDKKYITPDMVHFAEETYIPTARVLEYWRPFVTEEHDFSDNFKVRAVYTGIQAILYMNNPPRKAIEVVISQIQRGAEDGGMLLGVKESDTLPDAILVAIIEQSLDNYKRIKNPSSVVTERYQELLAERNKPVEVSSTKGRNSSSKRKELTSNQLKLMKNILSGVCSFLEEQYSYGPASLYDENGDIYLRIYSAYVVLGKDGSVFSRSNSTKRKIRIGDEEEFVKLIRTTVKNIEKLPFKVKRIELEPSSSEWTRGYIEDSSEEGGSKDITILC